MEGVNQIKDITIEWEGAGWFHIATDLPGGAMTNRRQLRLTGTPAGQSQQQTFPLDSPSLLEAKLIQYSASADNNSYLILRRAWIRHRAIGVYLNGAAAEKWETQPIALGG